MSWTCPKCDRELPRPQQRHYCARVSVDSLFDGRPAELVLVFDKILAEVADWDGVLVGTTPNCIVFTRRWVFLVIRPMKKSWISSFIRKYRTRKNRWLKVWLWVISLRTISAYLCWMI
ncbi:hypothetical protein HK413_01320 [Mucilaginibacter sp. S1162]|uniref:DUF5655 domain-containing protein n=1 Tax=Mucilaginibacter humi TaxID=2732510 RepID=A0ABX1VYV5_9SPHI|nr:DUF5655 domain-containing protein [Mucilaginibacter humi]NNU33152.1 hypothetical protein [Mucilaginibacter humi]